MTFTVVYDANVLYPNTLRDLLIRIAQSGTVQAKWTNAILDEMLAALRRNRPDIPAEKLPDPDDRHVLAAAIKAGAQVIVTRNLKDFPSPTFSRGTSRPNHPTRSSLTGCTSTSGRWPRRYGRSRIPGPTRPRQSKTSLANSNETASSNPSLPSARPNVSRPETRSHVVSWDFAAGPGSGAVEFGWASLMAFWGAARRAQPGGSVRRNGCPGGSSRWR